MKTIELTQEEMAPRLARFKDLVPLPVQHDAVIPLEARDIVYARKILSVVGVDGSTPVSMGAPIRGAGGMTMGIGVCPPGQGPDLHAHRKTWETFTVLQGRFEVRWNDNGDQSLILEKFDTLSVPPGVCRAFRNVSDEEGLLQAVITGDAGDMHDIDFARVIGQRLDDIGPAVRAAFEKVGFTFTASRDATD
jgi:quercetin dioxygenase-like cupin family protein